MGEEEHKESDLDGAGTETDPTASDLPDESLSEQSQNSDEGTKADPSVEDPAADDATDSDDPLRIELEQALSMVEKHRDEALRALAELDNVRKRAERDVAAAHKFAMEKFINELLPVKDSLDLGFDAANSAEDVEAIREGMA